MRSLKNLLMAIAYSDPGLRVVTPFKINRSDWSLVK